MITTKTNRNKHGDAGTRDFLIFDEVIFFYLNGHMNIHFPYNHPHVGSIFETLPPFLTCCISTRHVASQFLYPGSLSHHLGSISVQVYSPSHILNKCAKLTNLTDQHGKDRTSSAKENTLFFFKILGMEKPLKEILC